MNDANRSLTLQEAADHLGTSRSRLWRAMSDGILKADKRRVGGRSVWSVLESDLSRWAEEFLDDSEVSKPSSANVRGQTDERPRTSANDHEHSRAFASEHEQTEANEGEQSSNPPVELYLALVDRLQRAERRTVELELTLRQSQRLLTENAESITEKDALFQQSQAKIEAIAKESEAKLKAVEEAREAETAKLRVELESTRNQLLESQKPKGFLSWLGLRKKRASDTSNNSKAV